MNDKNIISKDLIKDSKTPLETILRIIFYVRKISKPEFNRLWEKHFKRLYPSHKDNTKMINNRNMMLKRICTDTPSPLTWNKFFDLIYSVLDYEILDLTITLKNKKTNKIEEYSVSDVENIDKLYDNYQRDDKKIVIDKIEIPIDIQDKK